MLKLLKKISFVNKLYRILSPKSLETRLQIRAADDTCSYIEEHMMKIHSESSRNAVIDRALEKVTLKGLHLEFGVFSGETINHVAKKCPNTTIYGFDSFEGLPEAWRDGYKPGHFNTKHKLPKVNKNVVLIKGWFEDTLKPFVKEYKEPVAFLHIDCDLYSSTKTIFTLLKDRIIKNTVIVFDEYFNYPGWREGEYKAFKEFVAEQNLSYDYMTYNRYFEQVAVIIK
ncbi:MAG: class I SAM-dependent methyltransferase [Bacteroidia bacterium]|nr:class I SAM-dependent methyltransferase [Bacteroidia bacterium]